MAVGLTPGHEVAFTGETAVSGSAHLGGPDEVILGATAAQHYAVGPGDSLTLAEHRFRVVGVPATSNELIDGAVLMPLGTMQQVFVRPRVVSSLLLTAQDPAKTGELAQAIEAAVGVLAALWPAWSAQRVDPLESLRSAE